MVYTFESSAEELPELVPGSSASLLPRARISTHGGTFGPSSGADGLHTEMKRGRPALRLKRAQWSDTQSSIKENKVYLHG